MILPWHNFGILSADISLKISWKYPQIVSIEDRAKHCLKSKWNLAYYLLTPIYVRLSLKEENEIVSTSNKWYVLYFSIHAYFCSSFILDLRLCLFLSQVPTAISIGPYAPHDIFIAMFLTNASNVLVGTAHCAILWKLNLLHRRIQSVTIEHFFN